MTCGADISRRAAQAGRVKFASLLLLFALVSALAGKDKPPAPAEAEKVILEPFKVRGHAQSNFAISIQVLVNKEQKKTKILITEVAPDSDASRLGLHEGDEIVKINGLPVADIEPQISKESPLGRLLLNRRPGETLDLEVICHQPRPVTLRAWSG